MFQHWIGSVSRIAYSANIFQLAFMQKITNNLTKYNWRTHKDIAIDEIYYKLLQALTHTVRQMCYRGWDSSAPVPNCPDTSAPVWQCRNVLGPKCPGSEVSWHPSPTLLSSSRLNSEQGEQVVFRLFGLTMTVTYSDKLSWVYNVSCATSKAKPNINRDWKYIFFLNIM